MTHLSNHQTNLQRHISPLQFGPLPNTFIDIDLIPKLASCRCEQRFQSICLHCVNNMVLPLTDVLVETIKDSQKAFINIVIQYFIMLTIPHNRYKMRRATIWKNLIQWIVWVRRKHHHYMVKILVLRGGDVSVMLNPAANPAMKLEIYHFVEYRSSCS
jgi:hypothetical protein